MVATDIKKRKRPSYVCTNCKKKKIRCDKDLPCGQCVRAECASSCVFEVSENNRIEKKSPPSMPYMVSAKRPLEFKKSEKVSRNGNQNQEEEATSELAMLKNKIREIEQKLQNNEENTQQPLPHIRDRNVYIPVQTNGNRSNFSSVQLPLNFKRDSMSIPSSPPPNPRFPLTCPTVPRHRPLAFNCLEYSAKIHWYSFPLSKVMHIHPPRPRAHTPRLRRHSWGALKTKVFRPILPSANHAMSMSML